MMFAFVGQIFQFFARPSNVDNYGFNFTLRHPLNLWKAQNDTFENLVLGLKCIGPKYFRTEVLLGPKCASGLSMLGAKVSVGLKLSWGQAGCEPKKQKIAK